MTERKLNRIGYITLAIAYAYFGIIFLSGCQNPASPPAIPGIIPTDPELVGTWNREDGADYQWIFSAGNVVTHYNHGTITVYGWYDADSEAGTIYIEEFYDGNSGTYLYERYTSYQGEILKLTPGWVANPVSTWWVRE